MKYTKVRLKALNVLTAHRRRCWYSQHVCDLNDTILNNNLSRKWFTFEWEKYKYQTSN